MSQPLVLVTGGSGFIGAYVILALLSTSRYRIRTTVRSLSRADDVRAQLLAGGASADDAQRVEVVAADLSRDDGWEQAVAGCAYVHHVASPFPPAAPKHEDELIGPAREGTLRVLRAAKQADSVKRVVVTSSVAAIAHGHGEVGRPFTEEDWSDDTSPDIGAYAKSKTLAERAAWEYIEKEGGEMELATVNPVAVYGPVLAKNYSTSIEAVYRLMNGQLPGVPQLKFGCVDVRDVADLHLRAMTDPKAKGQRYIAVAGDFIWMEQMAKILKEGLGERAKRVPTRVLPNFLLKLVGYVDPTVRMIVPDLGRDNNSTNEKAKSELGWNPRTNEEALVATAESLEKLGMVKK
ncbi:MAG: hypothetical protein M1821_005666 [Bathelium mastoideum]|nr:MAG: hypothetical protein M1821_005666 [Bathelium mastoideum]